jgi:hypothetical protein
MRIYGVSPVIRGVAVQKLSCIAVQKLACVAVHKLFFVSRKHQFDVLYQNRADTALPQHKYMQ